MVQFMRPLDNTVDDPRDVEVGMCKIVCDRMCVLWKLVQVENVKGGMLLSPITPFTCTRR